MSRKNKSKAKKSFFDAFLSFWATLPGILTGIAAVLTAVAGLYIAVWKNSHSSTNNLTTQPASSPIVSPTVVADSGNCFEQEFSGADQIEEGASSYPQLKDNVLRIKVTDSGKIIGALRLKIYPNGAQNTLFKVERVVDSKCHEIEEFSNFTRAGEEKHKIHNYDKLKVRFGDYSYLLYLEFDGIKVFAAFNRASQ